MKTQAQNLFSKLQADTGKYDKQPWLYSSSSKLIVLLHGLNSSPLAWSGYLSEIQKLGPKASCFAPYIYKKGYCKVSEAADPILDTVQAYAKQYPTNPIFLVGHSNGARIAAEVEQKLESKNIRLVSIAGPHLGSKLMKWIGMTGLAHPLGILL